MWSGRVVGRRQREIKRGAEADGAVDPDASAMTLDEVAGNGKAEPAPRAAGACLIDLVEALKNALLMLGRNARPRIADTEEQPITTRMIGGDLDAAGRVLRERNHVCVDGDAPVIGGKFDRVVHQIEQDLVDAVGVAKDQRERVADIVREVNVVCGRCWCHALDDVQHVSLWRMRRKLQGDAPSLDL